MLKVAQKTLRKSKLISIIIRKSTNMFTAYSLPIFPCKLEEIREIRMLVNLLRLMPRERRKILKSFGAVEAARFSHTEEQNSTPTTLGQKRKNENANLKAERIEKRRMKSEKLKSDLEAQLKAINKKFGHIDTLKKEEKKQTKN